MFILLLGVYDHYCQLIATRFQHKMLLILANYLTPKPLGAIFITPGIIFHNIQWPL